MTTSLTQFVIPSQLTSCRVILTSNLTGTYNNGTNGIGATLKGTSLIPLTLNGVLMNPGDRVCLAGQTTSFQNGIYVVTVAGLVWTLTRSQDFQNPEQIKAGYFAPIGAGSTGAGEIAVIIEPTPQFIGIDPINFSFSTTASLGTAAFKAASNNGLTTVSSVLNPVPPGNVATFSDTAGTLQAGGTLGDAAFKGVTSPGQPNVASIINGGPIINHIARFADGLGSITDGGPLGAAAAKGVTDNTQQEVVSLFGITSTIGALPVFNDVNGTIVDSTINPIAVEFPFAGGSATAVIADARFTINSVVTVAIKTSTNPVSIQKVTPTASTLTILMSADPGAATVFMVVGMSGTF